MVTRTETSGDHRQEGSIDEMVERLRRRGYIGDFGVLGIERMRCGACQEELDAHDVILRELARIDVTTDPDDQSVVAGLECPSCGARATRVFSYGPSASAEDSSSFAALRNERKAAR